VMGRRA